MRWIVIMLCALMGPAIAQEHWGGNEQVWCEGTGFGINFEPCFGLDSNEIFLSYLSPNDPDPWQRGFRLLRANYADEEPMERLFPESLSVFGYNDISPFLSYDKDRLYFASDRPGGFGGYDLYYCDCSGGVWTGPINLDSNINSLADEFDISLSGDEGEMYFVRGTRSDYSNNIGSIYRSAFVDSQWVLAESLGLGINTPYGESNPVISRDGDKLYLISRRPYFDYPQSAWISRRHQNEWDAPMPLGGFINYFWEEAPGMVEGAPVSIAVDSSGLSLLYCKLELFMQYDPEACCYLSYLDTGVEDDFISNPVDIRLVAYPNPFNGATVISYEGVPGGGHLYIYDITGRLARTLALADDQGSVAWNATGDRGEAVSSGIYFAEVVDKWNSTKSRIKLLYLK